MFNILLFYILLIDFDFMVSIFMLIFIVFSSYVLNNFISYFTSFQKWGPGGVTLANHSWILLSFVSFLSSLARCYPRKFVRILRISSVIWHYFRKGIKGVNTEKCVRILPIFWCILLVCWHCFFCKGSGVITPEMLKSFMHFSAF